MRFRTLALFALLALLAACAPQQATQVPSVGFAASPQQLYDALVQLGPTIHPGAGYTNYRIVDRGSSSVSFVAELALGTSFSFLMQDARLQVTCQVIPAQGRTDVGFVYCSPQEQAQQFYDLLSTRYRRL
ncbi:MULTISPECIES: hypothetical protein [unclassified Meiothermus]|uniref:hypothetical protein n=1 Tax=unclassified Meiothermus TaxID=370471 RepID=UPI000D7C9D18|nr:MULTISPECIES: hypothetical protein [unclassified Meiothermus]PZA06864.1 hypothetical protein DNA98_11700 [Meiothermus sp. Pnk-1]RYM33186.1 hypothetical protein EWH23_13645 [Meiothermus sp. PNK-Is4]